MGRRNPMKNLKLIKLLLIVTIIGCSTYIVEQFIEYSKAEKEYSKMQSIMKTSVEEASDTINKENKSSDKSTEYYLEIKKKINGLMSESKNMIGWLSITGTNIDYPLMQAIDNEYYLKHTFEDNKNSSGSIYLDCRNDKYFSDCHSIIYGHNMKNRSMFGNVREYMKKDYFDSHSDIVIYREDCIDRYKVFSAYVSAIDDKGYSILDKEFLGTEENKAFVKEIQSKSKFKTDEVLDSMSKVITLSTCTGDKSTRCVVHAVLISSNRYEEETENLGGR